MATIYVSSQDLANADTFLTAYLKDKITDADFSEGSVLRDFVVKAIAYIFAYLERERKITRDRQSLLSLSTLPAGESVDEAVDALLSNWFLTRKDGTSAFITAVLHFSQANDVVLRPTTQFFRTSTIAFTPNITSDLVIPASELRPNINSNGTITDYSVTVTLVAATAGTAGNALPGKFLSADPFNPYFLYAENLSQGQGGADIETTVDLLARAPTAISVRNLINTRSIDTVLRETFAIDAVRVIGFQDPEMIRDLSSESISGLQMHVGGYYDVYVSLPRVDVVESLIIGAPFIRPDGLAVLLRDASSPLKDFVALGVQPGHILRVNDGLPNTPREYNIVSVDTNTLEVQSRMAFPRATDEDALESVHYSVGSFSPTYDNIVASTPTFPIGETSRTLTNPGRVILQGRPQYKVTGVQVFDVLTSALLEMDRVNGTPVGLEYQVITRVSGNAQSAMAVTEVIVPSTYDGKTLRVNYETLAGYADIQAYVTDRFERVANANPLVKGFHPVYISMNLEFKLKSSATATVSPSDVSQVVADYINAFTPLEVIELSGILQTIRDNFTNIGAILSSVQLTYDLFAPDGQVYQYKTDDIVTITPKYLSDSARLVNGINDDPNGNRGLRTPIPNANIDPALNAANQTLFETACLALSDQLLSLGISDRTVRYFANASDITVTQVY